MCNAEQSVGSYGRSRTNGFRYANVFATPGYRLLQPPFNFFPALSLAANVDFGRPKGRSTMMGSPHFLAKVVVTGYRQL